MRMFFLLAFAGLFVSHAAHADPATGMSAPSADQLLPEDSLSPEEPPMISQGDSDLRTVRIGNTTVGKEGCLAVSLYDALRQMGLVPTMGPAAFIRTLSAYGFFTSSGLLRWSFGRVFPVWIDRLSVFGTTAVQTAAYKLSQGAQVLLEVATNHGTRHWVRVSRVINGDAEIRDPNGGRIGWLSTLYGIKSVRGMAILQPQ